MGAELALRASRGRTAEPPPPTTEPKGRRVGSRTDSPRVGVRLCALTLCGRLRRPLTRGAPAWPESAGIERCRLEMAVGRVVAVLRCSAWCVVPSPLSAPELYRRGCCALSLVLPGQSRVCERDCWHPLYAAFSCHARKKRAPPDERWGSNWERQAARPVTSPPIAPFFGRASPFVPWRVTFTTLIATHLLSFLRPYSHLRENAMFIRPPVLLICNALRKLARLALYWHP